MVIKAIDYDVFSKLGNVGHAFGSPITEHLLVNHSGITDQELAQSYQDAARVYEGTGLKPPELPSHYTNRQDSGIVKFTDANKAGMLSHHTEALAIHNESALANEKFRKSSGFKQHGGKIYASEAAWNEYNGTMQALKPRIEAYQQNYEQFYEGLRTSQPELFESGNNDQFVRRAGHPERFEKNSQQAVSAIENAAAGVENLAAEVKMGIRDAIPGIQNRAFPSGGNLLGFNPKDTTIDVRGLTNGQKYALDTHLRDKYKGATVQQTSVFGEAGSGLVVKGVKHADVMAHLETFEHTLVHPEHGLIPLTEYGKAAVPTPIPVPPPAPKTGYERFMEHSHDIHPDTLAGINEPGHVLNTTYHDILHQNAATGGWKAAGDTAHFPTFHLNPETANELESALKAGGFEVRRAASGHYLNDALVVAHPVTGQKVEAAAVHQYLQDHFSVAEADRAAHGATHAAVLNPAATHVPPPVPVPPPHPPIPPAPPVPPPHPPVPPSHPPVPPPHPPVPPPRPVPPTRVPPAATVAKGEGLLGKISKGVFNGVVEHGGNALSAGKKMATATTGFGKNVLIAGVAGTALLGLGALLSAPKAAAVAGNALAFSGGNSTTELGAIAMPAPGQQRSAGSWVSRLPSMQDQLASAGVPPSRGL